MQHRVSSNIAITVSILAALVVTPWFFGGVWTRTQSILLAFFAVLLVVDGLTGPRSGRRPAVVPVSLYPLVGGILLGGFQLLPLHADGAAKFSAGALRWRAAAAYADVADEKGVSAATLKSLPRSLYPPATRENVALLFLVTSVFWLSSRHLVDSRSAALMLGVLTVCGVVLALFALVQRFTWNGQIYWTYPLSQGGNAFGPFVNRNNAGGFLNLCLAVGLGAYVWETGANDEPAPPASVHSARGTKSGGQFGAARLLVVGALVFMAGAIVASASRGSILSLAFALAVVAAVMLTWHGRRTQAMGVVVATVAALALVTWLGEFTEVQSRFSQMASAGGPSDGRLLNWAEAAQAIPDFWFLGSGLNTYRFVCPPFQDRYTANRWHYYAENQYLQALVDGGVIALVLLVVTIGLVSWSVVCLYREGGRVNSAIATMGTFALASQLVGGAFDFGLYLGANAILMAAICGMVVGRAATEVMASPSAVQPFDPARPRRFRGLVAQGVDPLIALAISLVLSLWAGSGAVEMHRAANVEAVVEPAVQGRIGQERDDGTLMAAIGAANDAVRARPDDANGHRALAELWIQRYRVATFRSLRQQQPWMDESEAWQAASLLNWNNTLRDVGDEKRAELLRQVRNDEAAQSLLQPAWRHARRAQSACPWVPQTYLTLASLAPFVGENPETSEHLEKARQYAGGDPSLWYRIGLLEMVAGRTDRATLSWQRSLKLSGQNEGLILAELIDKVPVDQMLAVFPDDPRTRLRLARRLKPSFPEEARLVAETTLRTWDPKNSPRPSFEIIRGEHNALQAGLLALVNRPEDAISAWQKALAEAPDRTDWRTELVELLLLTKQASQAYDEALLGLEHEPNSAQWNALLQRCKSAMLQQTGQGQ